MLASLPSALLALYHLILMMTLVGHCHCLCVADGELTPGEAKGLTQGHTASKDRHGDSRPRRLGRRDAHRRCPRYREVCREPALERGAWRRPRPCAPPARPPPPPVRAPVAVWPTMRSRARSGWSLTRYASSWRPRGWRVGGPQTPQSGGGGRGGSAPGAAILDNNTFLKRF